MCHCSVILFLPPTSLGLEFSRSFQTLRPPQALPGLFARDSGRVVDSEVFLLVLVTLSLDHQVWSQLRVIRLHQLMEGVSNQAEPNYYIPWGSYIFYHSCAFRGSRLHFSLVVLDLRELTAGRGGLKSGMTWAGIGSCYRAPLVKLFGGVPTTIKAPLYHNISDISTLVQ